MIYLYIQSCQTSTQQSFLTVFEKRSLSFRKSSFVCIHWELKSVYTLKMSAITWSQHPKTAQTISKLPLPNSMLHEKPRGGFHIVYIVYT